MRKILKKIRKEKTVEEASFCGSPSEAPACMKRWAPQMKSRSAIKEAADKYMARFQEEEKAELERQQVGEAG